MKEKYIKPALFVESFALSQTIARNCGDTHSNTEVGSNHYNEDTCEWDVGDCTLFYGERCDEDMTVKEGMSLEEILEFFDLCYNNPSGLQTVFSST